jgi:hypothetical protein
MAFSERDLELTARNVEALEYFIEEQRRFAAECGWDIDSRRKLSELLAGFQRALAENRLRLQELLAARAAAAAVRSRNDDESPTDELSLSARSQSA